MPRYRLDAQAQADLKSVRRHIAADNPKAAVASINAIRQRIRLRAQNPAAGERVDAIAQGLRRSTVGSYVIYYCHSGQWIEIVRVLHDAMDAEREL